MGYMGFGLQKWIYKQNIRRPFGRSGKGDGYRSSRGHDFDIEKFFEVKFNEKFKDKKLDPQMKKILLDNLKLENKLSRLKQVLVIVITCVICGAFALYLFKPLSFAAKVVNHVYFDDVRYTKLKYYRHRNIKSVENYKNEEYNGTSVYFDDWGGVETVVEYENGKVIKQVEF